MSIRERVQGLRQELPQPLVQQSHQHHPPIPSVADSTKSRVTEHSPSQTRLFTQEKVFFYSMGYLYITQESFCTPAQALQAPWKVCKGQQLELIVAKYTLISQFQLRDQKSADFTSKWSLCLRQTGAPSWGRLRQGAVPHDRAAL